MCVCVCVVMELLSLFQGIKPLTLVPEDERVFSFVELWTLGYLDTYIYVCVCVCIFNTLQLLNIFILIV